MSSEVLLPCPFCGGTNLGYRLDDIEGWVAYVECHDCDDMTGPMSEFKYQDKDEAKADARERWNRRSASPSIGRVGVVTDEAVEIALHAVVPGGAEVKDWFHHHTPKGMNTAREVIRTAITAALPTLVYHDEPAGDTQGAGTVADETQWVMVPREPTEAMIGAGFEAWRWTTTRSDTSQGADIYRAMLAAAPAALVSPPDNGEARAAVLEEAAKVADRLAAYWSALPDDQIEVARKLAAHDVAVAIRALAGRAALQSHNEGSDGK